MSEERSALSILEGRVAEDLETIAYPAAAWVPAKTGPDGRRALDVLVVGAGQGGLAVAFKLLRERVTNIRVVDRARSGEEGPWRGYARMITLRSPKEVNGPDLDIPSLAYRSWHVARHGAASWETLGKIRKEDWADYLLWFRRVAGIPVENERAVTSIAPEAGLIRVDLTGPAGPETVHARKVVLATGIEASGRWSAPAVVESLPRRFWAHTADPIDFATLVGRRVAVLGVGASAMDNAATALEAGAASVTVFCRRPELQRVQPFRWLSFPGFMRHLADLDDGLRWRFMNHLLTMREAFPRETWERASRHAGFRLVTGAPWERVEERGDAVAVHTPTGVHEADFIIAGTGFEMDLSARPELSAVAPHAALWRDRYTPPEGEANPRLGAYPYLGPNYELTEREPGAAPWLANVHLFTFGSTMSFGPSGSSINAMKFAVPRLVAGITRGLFADDIEAHWRSLQAYDLPEFLFPGEEGEPAPTVAVIERPESIE
jgi:cation diffusion facilitator CzcD-associated flavoprotein CzcO